MGTYASPGLAQPGNFTPGLTPSTIPTEYVTVALVIGNPSDSATVHLTRKATVSLVIGNPADSAAVNLTRKAVASLSLPKPVNSITAVDGRYEYAIANPRIPNPALQATGTVIHRMVDGLVLPAGRVPNVEWVTANLVLPSPIDSFTSNIKHNATVSLKFPVVWSNAQEVINGSGANFAIAAPSLSVIANKIKPVSVALSLPNPATSISALDTATHNATVNLALPNLSKSITGQIIRRSAVSLALPAPGKSITARTNHQATTALTLSVPAKSITAQNIRHSTASLILPGIYPSVHLSEGSGVAALVIGKPVLSVIGQVIRHSSVALSITGPSKSIAAKAVKNTTANLAISTAFISGTGKLTHVSAANLRLTRPAVALNWKEVSNLAINLYLRPLRIDSLNSRVPVNFGNSQIAKPVKPDGIAIVRRVLGGELVLPLKNLAGTVLAHHLISAHTVITHNLEGQASVVSSTLGAEPFVMVKTFGATLAGWEMQQTTLQLAEFNDETVQVSLTNNGVPLDITGNTIKMYLKAQAGTPDSAATVLSSSGSSPAIDITNATQGQCTIIIPAAELSTEDCNFFRIDVVANGLQNTAVYGNITWITL